MIKKLRDMWRRLVHPKAWARYEAGLDMKAVAALVSENNMSFFVFTFCWKRVQLCGIIGGHLAHTDKYVRHEWVARFMDSELYMEIK